MARSIRNSAGFSLVEVMIAMVVLLVGILGVMGMQYQSVAGSTSSREVRLASNYAQQFIEQVRATPYASLASGIFNPGNTGVVTTGGVTFTRAIWVSGNCLSMTLRNDDESCDDADGNGALDGVLVPVCDEVFQNASAVRSRLCWRDRHNTLHTLTFNTVRWDENANP
jgi:type IV pilus assembly protein PilV